MGHIAEHIALEFQNLAGTEVRHGKTRSAGPRGQYNCIYEYREETVGLEAGRMAVALVNHLVAPDDRGRLLRFRHGAREPHPAGRAPGLRSIDPGAHRRGGQPGHPVHPSRPPLAGPVRARGPSAADPRDDDLEDERDRRRRRLGQEPHQPTARFGRPAGPARRRRRAEDAGGGRRPPARLPDRRQAARRQPRPRRPPRPALGRGGPGRVSRGPRRRVGAAMSSSKRTSPATTTAASSSAGKCRGDRRARPGAA